MRPQRPAAVGRTWMSSCERAYVEGWRWSWPVVRPEQHHRVLPSLIEPPYWAGGSCTSHEISSELDRRIPRKWLWSQWDKGCDWGQDKENTLDLKSLICGELMLPLFLHQLYFIVVSGEVGYLFTFTFRAFSWRFYPKRRTINTFVRRETIKYRYRYSKDARRTNSRALTIIRVNSFPVCRKDS